MASQILIVEDDPDLAGLVREHLESYGFDVSWADGPGDVLAQFLTTQPALVQARAYYESDRLQFSLILYLGSLLSLSFILASASLLYSRLHARARTEGERYAAIAKIGLSRASLGQVCWFLVSNLMALPIALALAYMWIGVGLVAWFTSVPILWPAAIFTLMVGLVGTGGLYLVGHSYARSVTSVAFASPQ